MRLPASLALVPLLAACGGPKGDAPAAPAPRLPTFVGRAECARCHPLEAQLHAGSHHDLAMDEATPQTVLGDFDGATHEHFGVVTTFSRDGERYLVETDGPDGAPTTYEVAYVFGVDPLQQLLIRFPGGRVQCLSVAWDARPEDEGGQRWFHLYPDEAIPAGDLLHWTGPNQRWNAMCARCHSTGLARGYDPATDSYDTTWHEIDVSCEACHGPGSRHVAWARDEDPGAERLGLTISLKDPSGGQWALDEQTGNALRTAPRASQAEAETCARCHSRRATIREAPVDGSSFHDQYRLSLLERGLYHADGQILDEVYVQGSFLQSRMHAQGVTCSDCHDPHSARLLFEGNALCARCHLPAKFDAPTHHHHPAGGAGTQCVDCHMPARTYMVVDPRRDHSLRVPRPDLSAALGTPNACNGCHDDRDAAWAAARVAEWFPGGRQNEEHYGQALAAGRRGSPDAEARLATLAVDPEQPAIVRATAIDLLRGAGSPEAARAVLGGLEDPDPLLRAAAVGVFDTQPESLAGRAPVVARLEDPVLLVRAEAARVLACVPGEDLPPAAREAFARALDDYVATQMANADRPGSHLNLGVLRMDRGRLIDAERSFRKALALDPGFVAGHVNLADLLRQRGREGEAEEILGRGLERAPRSADLLHALGLLQARTDRQELALQTLGRAAALAPTHARYAYVYAIALSSAGRTGEALQVLVETHASHPRDRDVLAALATLHRDAGDPGAALPYAELLVALSPQDRGAAQLLAELRAAAGGD